MITLRRSLSVIAVVAFLTLTRAGMAQTPANSPDYPFKVGDEAPEVLLKDQNGKTRSLKQTLKDSDVALVFYRSASW